MWKIEIPVPLRTRVSGLRRPIPIEGDRFFSPPFQPFCSLKNHHITPQTQHSPPMLPVFSDPFVNRVASSPEMAVEFELVKRVKDTCNRLCSLPFLTSTVCGHLMRDLEVFCCSFTQKKTSISTPYTRCNMLSSFQILITPRVWASCELPVCRTQQTIHSHWHSSWFVVFSSMSWRFFFTSTLFSSLITSSLRFSICLYKCSAIYDNFDLYLCSLFLLFGMFIFLFVCVCLSVCTWMTFIVCVSFVSLTISYLSFYLSRYLIFSMFQSRLPIHPSIHTHVLLIIPPTHT